MIRASTLALTLVAAGVAGACGRSDPTGPPDLRLGRDECAECGMLINEDRSSCALLVMREHHLEHATFDDIGCMLEFIHDHERDQPVREAWVHDYGSREWARAETAAFLFVGDNRLPTPMASGIAAFADAGSARAAQSVRGGEIMDWPAVARARRAWMESHYGKPPDRP